MGLDSTAMLIEMNNRGITPDIIMFSDVGAEKPETYAYLAIMNEWLESVGFPQITVVRYEPKTAPYSTLEGKCLANETLPSLAFGGHSCALVFKRGVMIKALKSDPQVQAAIARGEQIIKAIGYDDAEADRRRSAKALRGTEKIRNQIKVRQDEGKKPLADQWEAHNCDFWYPLQDWNLERSDLADIIIEAGLPVPVKSACFFCPASKPAEVVQMKLDHPDLYARAIAIERGARDGKHGLQKKLGLGMGGWAWEWVADCDDPKEAAALVKEMGGKLTNALRP
jgi:hypothetical protein